MTPALIAVAHGSRDPRSAATMTAVLELVRAARPNLAAHLAFLDLNAPSVPRVLDSVAAQGHRSAVVVPLLLGSAYHARVDLPRLLAGANRGLALTQTDVLAPDPRLITALRDRLVETGIDPADDSVGVAVAAVGSSSAAANARTRDVARMLRAGTAWHTESCFATAQPTVSQASATLRRQGATRLVIAPWFLAPGRLTDRLATTGLPMSPPLGPHPLLADLILTRYQSTPQTHHTAA